MERKLVTIRKIRNIEAIEGADRIQKATVDGWNVIISKDEFKVDEEILFVEIDSFLPTKEEFEFLRKSCFKKMGDLEGFRLRTIRLRKCLSQGLILPLSLIDGEERIYDKDYAELLDIVLYEAPIPAQLAGQVEAMFPSSLCPKTDQERIQNLPEYFEEHKDVVFEKTEKLDGSSCTMFWDGEQFGVCSRNLQLKESEDNTLWKLAKQYNIEENLKTLTPHAIQGEVIGEGIQKNPYKLVGQDFYVFDIYNIDERRYLTNHERVSFCEELGLKHVPLLGTIKLGDFDMETILKEVEGNSYLNAEQEREGCVFKSATLIYGHTISFKAINNKYLLKQE